ncbi:uncharacterized protein LOC129573486 [Sitodiplosis mosellana]|uniref:uncharacterized protein LOC129573486 n=1 Tax=Sitodiplosis mosellana TaxID=263140 RepID=UPI002444C953|nr:uncharacterized protein LOC129573486 [Sitodiplosis mosellana]
MRILLVLIALVSISLVCGDERVENETEGKISEETEESSVKTKRGIHGYASDLGYPLYSRAFTRYTPYARFPTVYKTPVATYALTPGNAIVHSFNVNYPKVLLPKPVIRPAVVSPVLYHPKPILPSVPIYANRYPVFVNKPVIVQKPIIPTVPQYSTSAFIPAIPPHIHTVNPLAVPSVLPQPTLVSQDGWRPIFSALPNDQHTHINPPAVTVLPPSNPLPTTSQTQTPNNYYLPPGPSIQHDSPGFSQSTEQYQHQQPQNDLQAHLQHLQQIQEIQQHQNFLRSEQNEGFVTSLSEQGYETASNNGLYSGPSSYDVHLNSRGRVN